MSSDDLLWQNLSKSLWRNKSIVCTGNVTGSKVKMQPYKKIFLDALGYKSLSALQIKYILKERRIDVRGCSEKSEFVALALSSQSPVLGCSVPVIPRPFSSKWKASFYVSLADGHRTRAVKDDICSYTWRMTFKNNPDAYPDWESSFHSDMTLTSEPNPNPGVNMTWCFYGSEDEYVRVGQYPPLIISRLPDWGWRMENQYVYFLRTNDRL
jgi:hypothetical protein